MQTLYKTDDIHIVYNNDSTLDVSTFKIPETLISASDTRKKEYLLGRLTAYCAAKPFLDLTALPSGDYGPIWPDEIRGSISHKKGNYVAIVTNHKYISVGIDIEKIISKDRFSSISKKILNKTDISDSTHLKQEELNTLIFSAKESLYKCINPIVKKFFDFHDASLISCDQNSFEIQLHSKIDEVSRYNQIYPGTYFVKDGLIISYILL